MLDSNSFTVRFEKVASDLWEGRYLIVTEKVLGFFNINLQYSIY